MRSLLPGFCLVAAFNQLLWADDGIEAYRKGNYTEAAKYLPAEVAKNPEASYYLGLMKLYGYGVLKNNAEALLNITNAASRGVVRAQALLARYYLFEDKKPEEAFQWFKKVAESNSMEAKLYVAGAYLSGYGVNKNPDAAKRYIIDAAKAGNSTAQYALSQDFLASRDRQNRKMGLIWLEKAAEKDNPPAKVAFAEILMEGKSLPQDLPRAVELLQKAAQANYVPAMIWLGKLAEKTHDDARAKEWYVKASEKNADGKVALGLFYLTPEKASYQPQEGFQLILKAAQDGSYNGATILSQLYKEGRGIEKNESLASEWELTAKKIADLQSKIPARDLTARFMNNGESDSFEAYGLKLGGIYNAWQNQKALVDNIYNKPPVFNIPDKKDLFKPQFVMVNPKDIPISVYFNMLVPALNESSNGATLDFPSYPLDPALSALLADESLVLKHDNETSIIDSNRTWPLENNVGYQNWLDAFEPYAAHKVNFQQALSQLYGRAILGESSAQYQLGQLYQYGIGVSKNIGQALTYLELAAMQQDIRAEYNLGMLYLQGQTTPQNYQKGIEWMTDAAFKGNAYAEYVLGRIYETGLRTPDGAIIVTADPMQANAMFYLAASNHFGEAEYRLAEHLVKEKQMDLSVQSITEQNRLVKRLYRSAHRHGIPEALLPLAFYNAMDSNLEKQKNAFEVASLEANKGNANAALLLAMMYERGIATPQDEKAAIHWYREATMNPVNAFILGTYYCTGQGVKRDAERCREFLKQASEAGFSYADLNLAILQHDNGEAFLETLMKAREAQNSTAGILLADTEMLESNNPEKIQHALSIYQYFAEKGDKDAQTKLGFLYDRGLAGITNPEFAEKWYKTAALQGYPLAQYLLAELYQFGVGNQAPDYDAAKKWYRRGMANYAPAATALGVLEETVENHYEKALEAYEKAAVAKDADGLFNLGLVYQYGKGVPVDDTKARALFKQALDEGHVGATAQLSTFYLAGKGGKQNIDEAILLLKKASLASDREALYQLGLLSETGVGMPLDVAAAITYYEKARELGDDKASFALARMYEYGINNEQDLEKAALLYKDLALKQNSKAQYALGMLYLGTRLKETEAGSAKNWLEMASRSGNQKAKILLAREAAIKELKLSFIEPLKIHKKMQSPLLEMSSELLYLEALNIWNSGEREASSDILNHLAEKYPNDAAGKRASDALKKMKAS